MAATCFDPSPSGLSQNGYGHTDTQTHRQTHRHGDRHTDEQTQKNKDTKPSRLSDTPTYRLIHTKK